MLEKLKRVEKWNKARVNSKGFTLIEFIVVTAIIAILIGGFFGGQVFVERSRETKVMLNFNDIQSSLTSFMFEQSGGMTLDGQEDFVVAFNSYLDTAAKISTDTSLKSEITGEALRTTGFIDPWGEPYEITFLNAETTPAVPVANTVEDAANSDIRTSIRIDCYGKSRSSTQPDYTMLMTYYNGDLRTATFGFAKSYGVDTVTIGSSTTGIEVKEVPSNTDAINLWGKEANE